jgi:hypothetical protein
MGPSPTQGLSQLRNDTSRGVIICPGIWATSAFDVSVDIADVRFKRDHIFTPQSFGRVLTLLRFPAIRFPRPMKWGEG